MYSWLIIYLIITYFTYSVKLRPLRILKHTSIAALSNLNQIIEQKQFNMFFNVDHYGYVLDPNVRSRVEHKALSPLHFAAWFNAAKAVDVLLRNGANVESGSAFGQKPLHYAVSRASAELVMVS